MTITELKKKGILLCEEDFQDSLYNCAYGGTAYAFYYKDCIYHSVYFSNMMTYMGRSYTEIVFQDVKKHYTIGDLYELFSEFCNYCMPSCDLKIVYDRLIKIIESK